jgi:hypothetical protein
LFNKRLLFYLNISFWNVLMIMIDDDDDGILSSIIMRILIERRERTIGVR